MSGLAGVAGGPGAGSRADAMAAWPALPLADWQESYATVHLWTQLLGKTRLALSPAQNHWWHTALYLTARGLTTSVMPYRERAVEVELDFMAERLFVRVSDGALGALPLTARPLAEFYADYRELLRSLGMELKLWPLPAEIADAVPIDQDRAPRAYDARAVRRCWQVLLQVGGVLQQFRGRFTGKCSPVHFWWGGFDLACTRFSGRTAPTHPGGMPALADRVARAAYSHECISAGWWPGTPGGPVAEPAFYAYAYPEPPGCSTAAVRPVHAAYHPVLHEWILPYDAVRSAASPEAAILAFLESTYAVAAELGGWDRAALENGFAITGET